ncbi:MAG TPA: hypothetical protein VGY98_01260 [Verrucomicrobiae bacterium]|nr:hypothetical protein [Verrucomicrobiae bacterium]
MTEPSQVDQFAGSPLVEIRIGKGLLIASELNFESAAIDPISRRLLGNVLNFLGASQSK